MKRVAILESQEGDWVGMYVDGFLIDQGHVLGNDDILFVIKMAEKYGFKSDDITVKDLCNEDQEKVNESGRFPDHLDGFICSYNHN